jgi:hypothetical protein
MFYKFENNELIKYPDGPSEFGPKYGHMPSQEEIEQYAGWVWFDTEQEAKNAFGITNVLESN